MMAAQPGTMKKLTGAPLPVVIERAAPADEAMALLEGCTAVPDAIDRLEAAGMEQEAVRVLAHSLPKREAVWWACMCAAHTAPPNLAEKHRRAREATELWVRQQTDETRRAAYGIAKEVEFSSPEAWTALAAFWSGDSLSLPDLPPAPPTEDAPGKAVAACLIMASARGDGTRMTARLKRFLESGRNIAAGGPGRIPPEEA